MCKDRATSELEKLISLKKIELNELFTEQGLSSVVIKKSQELDVLIVEIQTRELTRFKTIRININKK